MKFAEIIENINFFTYNIHFIQRFSISTRHYNIVYYLKSKTLTMRTTNLLILFLSLFAIITGCQPQKDVLIPKVNDNTSKLLHLSTNDFGSLTQDNAMIVITKEDGTLIVSKAFTENEEIEFEKPADFEDDKIVFHIISYLTLSQNEETSVVTFRDVPVGSTYVFGTNSAYSELNEANLVMTNVPDHENIRFFRSSGELANYNNVENNQQIELGELEKNYPIGVNLVTDSDSLFSFVSLLNNGDNVTVDLSKGIPYVNTSIIPNVTLQNGSSFRASISVRQDNEFISVFRKNYWNSMPNEISASYPNGASLNYTTYLSFTEKQGDLSIHRSNSVNKLVTEFNGLDVPYNLVSSSITDFKLESDQEGYHYMTQRWLGKQLNNQHKISWYVYSPKASTLEYDLMQYYESLESELGAVEMEFSSVAYYYSNNWTYKSYLAKKPFHLEEWYESKSYQVFY